MVPPMIGRSLRYLFVAVVLMSSACSDAHQGTTEQPDRQGTPSFSAEKASRGHRLTTEQQEAALQYLSDREKRSVEILETLMLDDLLVFMGRITRANESSFFTGALVPTDQGWTRPGSLIGPAFTATAGGAETPLAQRPPEGDGHIDWIYWGDGPTVAVGLAAPDIETIEVTFPDGGPFDKASPDQSGATIVQVCNTCTITNFDGAGNTVGTDVFTDGSP